MPPTQVVRKATKSPLFFLCVYNGAVCLHERDHGGRVNKGWGRHRDLFSGAAGGHDVRRGGFTRARAHTQHTGVGRSSKTTQAWREDAIAFTSVG